MCYRTFCRCAKGQRQPAWIVQSTAGARSHCHSVSKAKYKALAIPSSPKTLFRRGPRLNSPSRWLGDGRGGCAGESRSAPLIRLASSAAQGPRGSAPESPRKQWGCREGNPLPFALVPERDRKPGVSQDFSDKGHKLPRAQDAEPGYMVLYK